MQALQSFVEDNLLAVSVCLGVVVLLVLLIIVVAAISGHKSKKYEEIPEGPASDPGDTDDNDNENDESTSDQSPDNESDDDVADDDEDVDDIEVEEIDEAIPEQSEKKSDIEINSNQSHRKSKTMDESVVAGDSEQDQDNIEENADDDNGIDDDDEDNTYVIEKSAQAHAKRHEKREWQHESDQDKFDKKAYSQGVNFKYVPNKESVNKYRDMVESEDLSKKSKEEDEKALNEIREKEKEAELAAKTEDTFKQDTTALLEKMSKRIDELAATVNDAPASLSSADLEKQVEKLLVSFKAQEEKNSNHSKAVSDEISTRFKNGQNSIAQLSDDIASRQNDVIKAVDALKVGIQSVMVKEDNDYSEDFEKVQKEVDSLRTTIAGVNDMVYRSIVAIGNNAKKIEDSQKDVSSILAKLNALDEKVSNINIPAETKVTLNDESFLHRHSELLNKLDAIINKQEENANAVSSSFKGTQSLSQRHGNELEKIMDAVKAISVPIIIKQSEQNFEAVSEEKVVESESQDDAEEVHVEETEPAIEQEADGLPVEEVTEEHPETTENTDEVEQFDETGPAEETIEVSVDEVEATDEYIDDAESNPDSRPQAVTEEIIDQDESDDFIPEQVHPASSEDDAVVERPDSDETKPVKSDKENPPLNAAVDDISEKIDINSSEDAVVANVEPEEQEIQEAPAMEESPKEETVEKEANVQPEEAKPAEQVVPTKEPVKEETNKTSTHPPHSSQPKQAQGSAPEKKKEGQNNSAKTSQQAPTKAKKPVAKQAPKQAPKKGSNAKTGKGSGQTQKKPASGNNGNKKASKQNPNKKPQQRGMGMTKEERLKQLQQKEAEKQKQIDETISRAPIRVVPMSASNSSKMSKEEIAEFRKRGKERFERIQAKRKALEEAQAKESGQSQDNASAKDHNSGAIKAQVKPPVKAKEVKQELKPEADTNISSAQINTQNPTTDKAYDSAVKAEQAMSHDLDVALGLTGSTSEADENLTEILSEAPETNISSTVEESVGIDGEVTRDSEEYSDNFQNQVSTVEIEASSSQSSSQSIESGVASRVDYAEEAVSNVGEASVQESSSNAGYDSESISELSSRHNSEQTIESNSRHNPEQVVEAQTQQHQSQAYTRQGFRRRDSEVVQEEEKATVRPTNRSMRPTRPSRPTSTQTSSRPTRPTRPTRAHR